MTSVAERLGVALADRYRIERELGQGGMATVYLARDLKHDRDVAVKVLRPELGAALGSDRFLSEIKTTARLQHPHILPLLDSGDAGGLLYYVMPVVAGETLRTRLERERQLPIAEAVRIARQAASALDYAHRQGVIHRDIKPENILLHEGQALVADFGIALAVETAGGQRMTQTGLSLGTPQYMSPEQAMGEKSIDLRADIYALGAVTYEMLVGEPPFTGPTVQAIVAKAMTERPVPPSTVRDTVPAGVEQAVLRALAKLPADRFASAAQFAEALDGRGGDGALGGASRRTAGSRFRWREAGAFGIGGAVLALAGVLLATRRDPRRDPFPLRIEVAPAELISGGATLSPDGHALVYQGRSRTGPGGVLYLRRLDQLVGREIPGTANPGSMVFSPDGRWVAFVAKRRELVKVPLDGGAAIRLGDLADDGGLAWSASGDIVSGPGIMEGRQGLLRRPATGGPERPFTHVDTARNELSHQWPRVLADGKTVLFTIWYGAAEQSEIAAASLDNGTVVPLGVSGARALGVTDGHLVYVRPDGMAMAVPFDARRLRVTGVATPVQDSIRASGGDGVPLAFLTDRGGLVFAHGAAQDHLVWVDRTGAAAPAFKEPREFNRVRLSPDGGKVAVVIATGAKTNLWILDLATSTLTPLTSTGGTRNPVWSPDGRRVLYSSTHGGRAALWWQSADGGGAPVKAADPPHNQWNLDLSPDGRTVVYNALYNGTFNLVSFALDSTHDERELAGSPVAAEAWGRFSPDGRQVAYASDESGRNEVYVRPFPAAGGRVQVSAAGGRSPVWAPDGKRLYYREGNRMMSATVASAPEFHVVAREALFEGEYGPDFDVSRDGTRFLMVASETTGPSLVVIPDWLTELHRLTTAGAPR